MTTEMTRRPLRRYTAVHAVALWIAVAGSAVWGVACLPRLRIYVELRYDAPPGSPDLERVTVIGGAEKSSWHSIPASNTVSVVLNPEEVPPQVVLMYGLAGARRSWDGPRMTPGVPYFVKLRVDATGSVFEQHCALPCSLP